MDGGFVKKVGKFILLFLVINVILLSLFTLTSSISKNSIKKSIISSIEYIDKYSNYEIVDGKNSSTTRDFYADKVIINLMYAQNSNKPFKAIMESRMYSLRDNFIKDDLSEAVSHDKKPNDEYLRYWHGSIMILKPLFTIFNYQEIIMINTIIVFSCVIALLILLYKKDKVLSFVTAISFIVSYSFIVPLSFEYTWSFLLAIIVSIIALLIEKKGDFPLECLFIISGICTCFFDFLTTETLPILLPITLIILVRYKEKKLRDFKTTFIFIAKIAFLWGLAYILMWLLKWGLSSLVLNINALNYVTNEVSYRFIGMVEDNFLIQILLAIVKNVSSLMPFSIFTNAKNVLASIFIILIILNIILFKRSKGCWFSKLLYIIGFIPIIRFIVLSNHSYLHYFFSFRALIPTIITWSYAVYYNRKYRLKK